VEAERSAGAWRCRWRVTERAALGERASVVRQGGPEGWPVGVTSRAATRALKGHPISGACARKCPYTGIASGGQAHANLNDPAVRVLHREYTRQPPLGIPREYGEDNEHAEHNE
jgi:hypothetical protein